MFSTSQSAAILQNGAWNQKLSIAVMAFPT